MPCLYKAYKVKQIFKDICPNVWIFKKYILYNCSETPDYIFQKFKYGQLYS